MFYMKFRKITILIFLFLLTSSMQACQGNEFVTKIVLTGKVQVLLPKYFNQMTSEMLAAKYPASNRPTKIYTNKDGTINFAFNHTANQITKDKLPEVLPAFVQQFNSIYPQIQWLKK